MKRFIFFMLTFFLTFNSHAAPQGLSSTAYVNPRALKETSPRNVNELGSISESSERSGQIPAGNHVNGDNTAVPNLARKKGKTALSSVTCKTYEGKIYNKGEAGYNDCIRTIKTDRQSDRVVP